MKSTGIVRKLDELGRITLPIELRRTLGIEERGSIEISVEGESIILNKYETRCIFCGRTEKDSGLVEYEGKMVCSHCIDNLGCL